MDRLFSWVGTPQTDRLDMLLGQVQLAVADIILTEVLQGFARDRDFGRAPDLLTSLLVIDIGGRDIAIEAARNFRRVRALGITIRKTVDTLIATRCLVDDHALLSSDRDFDPFVAKLGLRDVMAMR